MLAEKLKPTIMQGDHTIFLWPTRSASNMRASGLQQAVFVMMAKRLPKRDIMMFVVSVVPVNVYFVFIDRQDDRLLRKGERSVEPMNMDMLSRCLSRKGFELEVRGQI